MTAARVGQAKTRTSQLGGEILRRGLLAHAPRSLVCRAVGLAALLVTVFVTAFSGSLLAAVAAIVGLAAVWFVVWPTATSEPRLDRALRAHRAQARARAGLTQFVPAHQLRPGDTRPAWMLPPPVGSVAPLELAGSAADGLFVLHHANPGERHYLSVLCATDGLGSGLRSEQAYAGHQEGFGLLLAAHAETDRLLTGLQQINRVVPHDPAQHRAWITRHAIAPLEPTTALAAAHPGIDLAQVRAGHLALLDSYDELIADGDGSLAAEQHRNYLVARFDLTDRLLRAGARLAPDAPSQVGWALAVRNELRLLQARAADAGLGRLDVLGEQRTVAAMLALQNPDHPPDRHGGLRWEHAFAAYTTGDNTSPGSSTPGSRTPSSGTPSNRRKRRARRSARGWLTGAPRPAAAAFDHLVIDDAWYTRTAYLPAGGLAPALLGPRWLAPLLTDVSPAVVRTVSTRITLIPAGQARTAAVADKTSDTAVAIKNTARGKVDDGTDTELLSASARRLADLAPGSRHAGIGWGLFVTVQAPSYDELLDACDRLSAASGKCGITRWVWCDLDQDTAWPAALPLARGLRT